MTKLIPALSPAWLWAGPVSRLTLERPLSWVEWAERHCHITRGAHRFRGRWRADSFPLMGAAMTLVDRPWVREASICGPTRGSKTQTFGVNLLARGIAEGRELLLMSSNMLLAEKGLRELEECLAADADLRPVVSNSEGEKDARRYPNGAVLNLAGANSKSQLRAFNSEIAVLSELDAFRSQLGDEAGPAEQAVGRTDAYEETRKVIRESTPSVPTGPIWKSIHSAAVLYRPFLTCPNPSCAADQILLADTTDGLTPADAKDPLAMSGTGGIRWDGTGPDDAQRTARYHCPHCGHAVPQSRWPAWIRTARWLGAPAVAVADYALGETDAKGNPRPAPDPPVLTAPEDETERPAHIALWWSALVVPWSSLGVLARRLAEGKLSGRPQSVINHRLAWVYAPAELVAGALPIELVNTRCNGLPRGTVPTGAEKLTAFVDVSTTAMHWAVVAWKPAAAGFVIDYGVEPVYRPDGNYRDPTPQQRRALEIEWQAALTRLADAWSQGYPDGDGQSRPINLVLVDMGYEPSTEVVYQFCASRPAWCAAKGWTLSRRGERYFTPILPAGAQRAGGVAWWTTPDGGRRRVGDHWHASIPSDGRRLITADVSFFKRWVHDGFRLDRRPDAPQPAGSLSLYGSDPKAHEELARHVTAEQQIEEVDRYGRSYMVWKKSRSDQHWLDALVGCRVAAAQMGLHASDEPVAPKPPPRPRVMPRRAPAIRPATAGFARRSEADGFVSG